MTEPFDFRGVIGAYGGNGSSPGGPGTTYLQIRYGVSVKRILKVYGQNRQTGRKVFLNESGGYYHVFDTLEIGGKALVSLQQVNTLCSNLDFTFAIVTVVLSSVDVANAKYLVWLWSMAATCKAPK